MLTLHRRTLLTAGGAIAGSMALPHAASADTHLSSDPLASLLAGNRRFAAGRARHPRQGPARVREVAAGQHPFAVILGCADSRLTPEILFDQGIGDLFDNRVAGNLVDDILLGSIEYAVEEFVPPVIMVLGHERCGAISATLDAIRTGAEVPGHIAAVVDALRPIVEPYVDDSYGVEKAVRANVRAQAEALVEQSEIVHEAVESGATMVVGARYDLDSGLVTLVR
ncbi:carbonic anhydrase [Actinoplanes campanulatus]|uniref:carbonic anhydrase n=1 Tax=Actinoplanes campanulatus TaxID=113559 RepID=A0A7W5ACS8_9ACTN|nr:carbonic anhydrase [Actinoplanes campanulatus]MBB3093916.1 carbonic anhydrase [Actinoplanes campanulatus]GGN33765.1 carbonic anhydrase [Actinoplanes campanulatus]GID38388.1 carbonic anhydrase [Actinoplanes campanulatus]